MRVALISPYSGIEATGLRLLSACLKRAGFETRMIFLPNLEEAMAGVHFRPRGLSAEIVAQIVAVCADVDLIGLSVMTPSFHLARALTEALHTRLAAPILWGGIHPTIRPNECLQYADLVCIGEGEQAIVELTQRLEAGQGYRDINNLAYLDETGHLVQNPLNPLQADLDALPFPDYAFEQHYLVHAGQLTPCTQSLMHYYMTDLGSWAKGPVYGILTMRGCPYRCTYCANNALVGIYPGWSRLRKRSPAHVIAEIQEVRTRLPQIEAVILRDDTFLANPEDYIVAFCEQYQRDVGLPFRAYTTAQTANPAKLRHLTQAGLCYVIMGIQSGSPHIQQLYDRKVSNEQVLRAAHVIHSFKQWVPRPTYDLITDNPYETVEDRWETLRLIHQLPAPYRLSLYTLTFYPGTELQRRAVAGGLIEAADQRSYEYNFQIFAYTYYNLALFCHSLNLPRPFLHLLTRVAVFRILSMEPLNQFCGWLLKGLLVLRLWSNQRLYSRRRGNWLADRRTDHHA